MDAPSRLMKALTPLMLSATERQRVSHVRERQQSSNDFVKATLTLTPCQGNLLREI